MRILSWANSNRNLRQTTCFIQAIFLSLCVLLACLAHLARFGARAPQDPVFCSKEKRAEMSMGAVFLEIMVHHAIICAIYVETQEIISVFEYYYMSGARCVSKHHFRSANWRKCQYVIQD